jgi:hypothetical protein
VTIGIVGLLWFLARPAAAPFMHWPRHAAPARSILTAAFRNGHPLDPDLTGAAIAFQLLHLDATIFCLLD